MESQLYLIQAQKNNVFPSTRYQGSKAKLVHWIWSEISELPFTSCLDAFGGTGSMAYKFKQENKKIIYNDLLKFNYLFGKALVENSKIQLSLNDVEWLLQKHSHIEYPNFIQDNFEDIYFTNEENCWLDQTITNIRHLENPFKYALAFFALSQSCIIKRPYNLFHRKNLYIRLADVKRTFGNKVTWDKPFEGFFRLFVKEANLAVFDNGKENLAFNIDTLDFSCNKDIDLVYIDTPYISQKGVFLDYLSFYHFLEGLTMYDKWDNHIDRNSKHLRLKVKANDWTNQKKILSSFDSLFKKFETSIIVVSYRSDGIPTEEELIKLLKKYKQSVKVKHFGQYKYVLSTNSKSKEILLIGR